MNSKSNDETLQGLVVEIEKLKFNNPTLGRDAVRILDDIQAKLRQLAGVASEPGEPPPPEAKHEPKHKLEVFKKK